MGESAVNIMEAALTWWNDNYDKVMQLLFLSPETAFGAAAWEVITAIVEAIKAIGYALVILFFYMGFIKKYHDFEEVKKLSSSFGVFFRLILTFWGLDISTDGLLTIMKFGIGVIQKIASINAAAIGYIQLPDRIADNVSDAGFFVGILYCAIGLMFWAIVLVLSLVILLTVYGRIFKIMIYIAIAPLPIASFAGDTTSRVGANFIKSYIGVVLEGIIIALCMVIFNIYVNYQTGFDFDNGVKDTLFTVTAVDDNGTYDVVWKDDSSASAGALLYDVDALSSLKSKWEDYKVKDITGGWQYYVPVASVSSTGNVTIGLQLEFVNDWSSFTSQSLSSGNTMKVVLNYIGNVIFLLLILAGSIKTADMMSSRIFGL